MTMTSIARFAAWVALALVPIVGLGPDFAPRVVPTLNACLAGVASLCARPAPAADQIAPGLAAEPTERLQDPATLRVPPACGVA
jgi:hypothetical protein